MPEETDRLDSWKQIAAYLQKSERTVRRWHETEGLPVHKHQHQQRGSVWAYGNEVDEWLERRRILPTPPTVDEAELIEAPGQRRRWMWPGMLGVVLAACGGAFWLLGVSPAPPVVRLPHPVALTSLPGVEFGAAFSPDGKRVAFYWSGPSRQASGVYIKTLGSESVTPLILGGSSEHFVYGPAWSPDGRTIAYLRRTETKETWLCLVASSGGPEKRLLRLHDKTAVFGAENRHLDWSLDSRRVLAPLQVGEREQAIHWISVDSAAAQRITEPTLSDQGPVASPNRQSLVFLRHVSSAGGGQELLLQKLKPDGSADGPSRLLMRDPGFISGVAWVPGGNDLIVCKREPGTSSSLYRMPARPGGRLIPISGEECSGVEVSRANEKGLANLVYGANREPNEQLWKADLNDLERGSPFAPSSRSDTFPAFSPDGTSVAFRSTRSGASAAWVANQDGTQPRRVTDLQPFYGIEWSPDSNQILFGSVGEGLAIVPLSGGPPSVISAGGVPGWPHWSHGSGLIYYFTANRLFQIRPDGSGRAPVGDPRSQLHGLGELVRTSPDGKTLFLSRTDGLFRGPSSGEGAANLIEPNLLTLSISVTRTTLYYLRREDKALYGLSFAGGPPKRRGILHPFDGTDPGSVTFTVSPDDRRIVWSVGNSRQIDLELISDFR
jgi:Tol biopolymer transport system component